jgi:crotonobetainyl-CoA:carnitine CoA-transferase CaiB-like acyl-CoA transferase
MTELHRELRRHAHDGKLLDLCGGLQRTLDRLDALLASYAAGDGPPIDSPLVEAMLGIIAIRNRLGDAFAVSVPVARGSRAPTPAQESLLR